MAVFVRIVDKGSLTAAANALDTSLPTVVRTLAALERQLGVSLLNRTTRRIHLTDAGAQYLDPVASFFRGQDAEAKLNSQSGRAARQADGDCIGVIRPALRRADRERIHPAPPGRQRGNVVRRSRRERGREGLDVAVRVGHLRDSSLVAIRIGEVRRVVCASPRYLRRHGVRAIRRRSRSHRCVRHTARRRETNGTSASAGAPRPFRSPVRSSATRSTAVEPRA